MTRARTIYGVVVEMAEGVDYERDVVPAVASFSAAVRATATSVIDSLIDMGLLVGRGADLNREVDAP